MFNLEERIKEQKIRINHLSKPYIDQDNKSELGNDFAAFRKTGKKKGAEKVLHFLDKTVRDLIYLKLTVEEFNASSFRITDGVKTIDYYPKSNKMFSHQTKKWTKIKSANKIKEFILKNLE